jgi:hypothetical protein
MLASFGHHLALPFALSLFFAQISKRRVRFSLKQVATFSALYCHDIVMHENLMAVHSYHFLVLLPSFLLSMSLYWHITATFFISI